MHYVVRFFLGGCIGFVVTLAVFLYWARLFDEDDMGFGIPMAFFYLTALGAGLGVVLGFFTRPRKVETPSDPGTGLSSST